MNEEKRKILQLIEELLERQPDTRFCQLMYNITYPLQFRYISGDMFYILDSELIEALENKLEESIDALDG